MYFIAAPDHHGGDGGGHRVHDTMQDVLAKTAVILNPEHVALAEPIWDRVYGTRDRPELIKTNQLGPSWWGVYGSERLAQIVKESFAIFGVPTQVRGDPGHIVVIIQCSLEYLMMLRFGAIPTMVGIGGGEPCIRVSDVGHEHHAQRTGQVHRLATNR